MNNESTEIVSDNESVDLTMTRDENGHLAGLAAALRGAGIDTADLARAIGEDTVSGRTYTVSVTDADGTDLGTTEMTGDLIVGAAYERAQTMALPVAQVMYLLLGVLGALRPHAVDAVLAAIEAGMTGGDPEATLAERGFNLSESAAEGGAQALEDMRQTSTRTVSARVTFEATDDDC